MKPISLPPDAASLMWSTRAIGYTTPAAVADLIDNSISAEASNIYIKYLPGANGYVSILDDGKGMSSSDLILAMKYGSSSPFAERLDSDLGRFGLGLKTASLSQCRKLTVASKKNNSICAYSWDLDYILSSETGSWDLLELDNNEILLLPQIERLSNLNEGTLVVWNNLDRMCAGDEDKETGFKKRIKEVEEHLSLTFHRFLQGEPGLKKLSIYSNEIQLEPADPFYISRSDEKPSEKILIPYTDNHGANKKAQVIVTPYILPFPDSISQEELDRLGGKEGLIKNQGFYVYRNKRLIVAASWFRLARKTDLSKLCRIRVDMPSVLDELWTIDVKKSMALPPEAVLRDLRRIVVPSMNSGKKKYRFRATNETKRDYTPLWISGESRKGIIYSINPEYPLLKQIYEESPNPNKIKVLIRLIEQNIPVNTIHSDFYDDKKYAFEDVDEAFENVKQNIRELLSEIPPDSRQEAFEEIMSVRPFSEYELTLNELGDI